MAWIKNAKGRVVSVTDEQKEYLLGRKKDGKGRPVPLQESERGCTEPTAAEIAHAQALETAPTNPATGENMPVKGKASAPAANTQNDEQGDTPNDTWTIPKMKAYAEANGINVDGLTRKADILAAITSGAGASGENEEDEENEEGGDDEQGEGAAQ